MEVTVTHQYNLLWQTQLSRQNVQVVRIQVTSLSDGSLQSALYGRCKQCPGLSTVVSTGPGGGTHGCRDGGLWGRDIPTSLSSCTEGTVEYVPRGQCSQVGRSELGRHDYLSSSIASCSSMSCGSSAEAVVKKYCNRTSLSTLHTPAFNANHP